MAQVLQAADSMSGNFRGQMRHLGRDGQGTTWHLIFDSNAWSVDSVDIKDTDETGHRKAAFINSTEKPNCSGSSAAVHTLRLVLVKVLRGKASGNMERWFVEMATRRAIVELILSN